MSRKMFVDVTINLVITAEEDIQLLDIIEQLGPTFYSGEGCDIDDFQITNYKLLDSK